MARIPGMDVEKCHDEVAVEDRTGRELAGEDSTKDTWIHTSPFSRAGRNQILDEKPAKPFHELIHRAVTSRIGAGVLDRSEQVLEEPLRGVEKIPRDEKVLRLTIVNFANGVPVEAEQHRARVAQDDR